MVSSRRKTNVKDGNCPRVLSESDDSVADFARSEKCDANKDFRSMEKDGSNEKSKSHACKGNPCYGELKGRKAVSWSDLGVFTDIAPVNIKKSKNIFRVSDYFDCYKIPVHETHIKYGSAMVEDLFESVQIKATLKFIAKPSPPKSKMINIKKEFNLIEEVAMSEDEYNEEAHQDGSNTKDVLAMSPIIVIKFKEVKALKKNNNESVNAIIDLIVVREAYLLKSSLVLRMI